MSAVLPEPRAPIIVTKPLLNSWTEAEGLPHEKSALAAKIRELSVSVRDSMRR
jgi:hypothetical protein